MKKLLIILLFLLLLSLIALYIGIKPQVILVIIAFSIILMIGLKFPLLALLGGALTLTIFLSHNHVAYWWQERNAPQFSYIHSLKTKDGYYSYTPSTYYTEYVLVKDVPKDTTTLKKMMIDYRDSIGTSLDAIVDPRINWYTMDFYKKNFTTSIILHSKDERFVAEYSSEYLTNEDKLGTISSKRCTNDSTKWNTEIETYHKKSR